MPVPVYGLLAVTALALIAMLGLAISRASKNKLIRRALQKFIIPELTKRGLTYSHHKYLKSFSGSGQTIPLVSMRDRQDITIRLEIFYLDDNVQGSVIVEIKTVTLIVRGVSFNFNDTNKD